MVEYGLKLPPKQQGTSKGLLRRDCDHVVAE
jgi:hypothetical protein